MRKRPDQLGRPRGVGAGAPTPAPFWAGSVGRRRWFVDADIVVSPWEYTGCNTDDVQSVTSTAHDNPGYFHRKDPSATGLQRWEKANAPRKSGGFCQKNCHFRALLGHIGALFGHKIGRQEGAGCGADPLQKRLFCRRSEERRGGKEGRTC